MMSHRVVTPCHTRSHRVSTNNSASASASASALPRKELYVGTSTPTPAASQPPRTPLLKERDIEKLIQDAFFYGHRITLHKTDAGDAKHRAANQIPVMIDPTAPLLLALGCPQDLPFGIRPCLRLPKGFPDLAGPIPAIPGKWLFVEVKRPSCQPTKEQAAFLAGLRQQGHIAIWARSLHEAVSKFEEAMKFLEAA